MSLISPLRSSPLLDRFAAVRADAPLPAGVERAADDAVQALGAGGDGERAGERRTGERATALDQLRQAYGAAVDRGGGAVVRLSPAGRAAAGAQGVEGGEEAEDAEAAEGAEAVEGAEGDEAARADDGETSTTGEALSEDDLRLIEQLEARDREVRTHEQAHKSVGGRYAGAISYDFERGPDGERYAVGGEVSIDIAEVPGDPAATIRKMQVVRRAALAPAEPSGADRAAAAEASQRAAAAQGELRAERAAEAKAARDAAAEGREAADESGEGRDDGAEAEGDAARPAVDGGAIRRVSGPAGIFVGRRAGADGAAGVANGTNGTNAIGGIGAIEAGGVDATDGIGGIAGTGGVIGAGAAAPGARVSLSAAP